MAVCVDDVGLSRAVNAGALKLVAQGRCSALSCLTRAPALQEVAATLRDIAAHREADLGLHLNLSEALGPGQWQLPLKSLWLHAYTDNLPMAAVRAEISAQFDAFEDVIGGAPEFVDGHQHVHQLPIVRELLLGELKKRYPLSRPWLRNTQAPSSQRWSTQVPAKQRIIAALGARGLSDLADERGYPQNRGMLGVYGFAGSVEQHRRRLAGWCETMPDGGLLMAHVADGATAGDPISSARQVELEVLSAAALGEDLKIVRLSRILQCPADLRST